MDLYDGYNSSATLVIRMAVTNRKTVNAFVSSSDVLYITFVSDYSIQYSGFQILYFSNNTASQPACDEILDVSSQEQVLMSPNLPDPYDAVHSCSWSFSSTTGILFQIKFLDMGDCGQSHLRFYDGNSTDDNQLATECSTALTYEFDNIITTGFVGHIAWTVTSPSSDYYGFMLVYRTNVVTTTSISTTTITTTTPSPTTTTSTTTTSTTTTTVSTTTMTPGVSDNCADSGAYIMFKPSCTWAFTVSFFSLILLLTILCD
ncbi:dorsal-ventral patterning tolloid-like protein 1 [Mercenaria mercenaria]|uniref:dorsal-ventral patterning tolloid-like protein 1 n=1 Tax=Mercenaria mercenaria TaxID=6596 RepID=UPI00234F6804|nr:dorsal-ventral patterning tolloid-like protein 1 [Mercenaria mercenaria]